MHFHLFLRYPHTSIVEVTVVFYVSVVSTQNNVYENITTEQVLDIDTFIKWTATY